MSDPLLPMPGLRASKPELGAPRSPTSSFWGAFQAHLCIGLHLILVLVHVALVVVISHHYEHRVSVDTGHPANRLSLIVTASSQTIGTVSLPHSRCFIVVDQLVVVRSMQPY